MTDPFGDKLVSYMTVNGRTVEVRKRGKHYIAPRGGVDRPSTGPDGETCGSCRYLVRIQMAKTYLKCGLNRGKWTGGGKTDVRSRWKACSRWEKRE